MASEGGHEKSGTPREWSPWAPQMHHECDIRWRVDSRTVRESDEARQSSESTAKHSEMAMPWATAGESEAVDSEGSDDVGQSTQLQQGIPTSDDDMGQADSRSRPMDHRKQQMGSRYAYLYN